MHAIDSLFTSASAVSTTGLVTISIADNYSFWGQLVVMLLIQIGGIGYMTFGSFVLLSRGQLLSEEREELGRTVFSLPLSFRLDKFIKSVIGFTVLIELAGAVLLYALFLGRGVPNPAWSAVFHSVSAFCTAGFSLFNNSFESFAGDFWINLVIGALSYCGAIGFIVFVDLWRRIRGKVTSMTLTSKIIFWSTFWLFVIGSLLIFLHEPSIQQHAVETRLIEACFQSMTAITTVGFNTLSIGAISKASLLLIIVLMVVGASPAGTGGGLKSTTFTALFGVMRSALRGQREVTFWRRAIPAERVWTAAASLCFYLSALLVGTYLLELTESSSFDRNMFEAASALGTVGLSTGITAELTKLGKIIVVLLMYCGRVGPLTFGIALFAHGASFFKVADDDLAV